MPCQGLRGVEYVDACVARFFNNDWAAALEDFVSDSTNCWCPTWIKHNYDQMNSEPERNARPPPTTEDKTIVAATSAIADANEQQFAHASKFAWPVVFADAAEPAEDQLQQGADADDGDTEAATAEPAARDPWKFEDRPAWQQHSELGPNPGTTAVRTDAPPLPDIVNPAEHDYTEHARDFNFRKVAATWAQLPDSESQYSNPQLTGEALGDDFQRLFVEIVLEHAVRMFILWFV